jgi:hypothetical protein
MPEQFITAVTVHRTAYSAGRYLDVRKPGGGFLRSINGKARLGQRRAARGRSLEWIAMTTTRTIDAPPHREGGTYEGLVERASVTTAPCWIPHTGTRKHARVRCRTTLGRRRCGSPSSRSDATSRGLSSDELTGRV